MHDINQNYRADEQSECYGAIVVIRAGMMYAHACVMSCDVEEFLWTATAS